MTNTVAIVTGGSSGIGRATALRLARDFSAVVVTARDAEGLASAADEIRAAGADALAIDIDLSEPEAAGLVVEKTRNAFGRIDALVNIAGAVPGIDLFDLTDAQWDMSLKLKFHGARRLTLKVWDALKMSKGAVVFTSGTGAEIPNSATAAIGTINAAIEALAKAFADRGLKDGVQVNSVSPGPIMTKRRQGLIEAAASARGITVELAKQKFLEQAGITRFGEPEEIAELMAFAVSPAARWMTGTVLRMDGGEVKSI
ncbi:SDR family oxidoreductase [Neorhizobium sp. Rsf11]|uniref:SDR family oxidoreductase n=2 Tax=Neorhizobium TaxID=1525371 RepID=A0ABV0MC36_9HYPH|nr:SDR family oxidoreductase [Neorhizobium petrolearium]MCC2613721.1 SDR family oxidoreductase [Neorhizobium petrolearium]WGI72033.1 SDR family oxidoreductase [Neorhizobium petrolearium]